CRSLELSAGATTSSSPFGKPTGITSSSAMTSTLIIGGPFGVVDLLVRQGHRRLPAYSHRKFLGAVRRSELPFHCHVDATSSRGRVGRARSRRAGGAGRRVALFRAPCRAGSPCRLVFGTCSAARRAE